MHIENVLLFTLGNVKKFSDITLYRYPNPEADSVAQKRSQELYDALINNFNIRYWACGRYGQHTYSKQLTEEWSKKIKKEVVDDLALHGESVTYSIQMAGHPNIVQNNPYFIIVDYVPYTNIDVMDSIHFPCLSKKEHQEQDELYYNASGIITHTPTQRYMLINWLKIPNYKVTSILPSVASEAEILNNNMGYKKEIILWVGFDFTRKGGQELLYAFKKIREIFPKYKLVMIGQEGVIQEENVQCYPFLSDDSIKILHKYYEEAYLFVMPSYRENTGLVYLEAMAHGTPVVVTTRGGLAEVIRRTQTGLVCKPGDIEDIYEKIKILLTDTELYNKMRENAYSFTLKNTTHEIFSKRIRSAINNWLAGVPVYDDYIDYNV